MYLDFDVFPKSVFFVVVSNLALNDFDIGYSSTSNLEIWIFSVLTSIFSIIHDFGKSVENCSNLKYYDPNFNQFS